MEEWKDKGVKTSTTREIASIERKSGNSLTPLSDGTRPFRYIRRLLRTERSLCVADVFSVGRIGANLDFFEGAFVGSVPLLNFTENL